MVQNHRHKYFALPTLLLNMQTISCFLTEYYTYTIYIVERHVVRISTSDVELNKYYGTVSYTDIVKT